MKNTAQAFIWITDILERHDIPYKIFGGFAARVYGVDRELADIDIEVSEIHIPTILADVKDYVVFGPDRYKDEDWDLELLTLNHHGQEIDIAGTGVKIFNKETRQWDNGIGDPAKVSMIEVYGKIVPIDTIDSLIAYKTKLARDVDIEDVRQLLLIKDRATS